MKVYFDQQIWSALCKEEIGTEIIKRAGKISNCKYYLSVAHLEELHSAEKRETKDNLGLTGILESYMKKYAVTGVIKETVDDIRFHEGEIEYQKARDTVWRVDTIQSVQSISDLGLKLQKANGVDPKTLFAGKKQNLDTEYIDVWELDVVRNYLINFNVENVKYQDLKTQFPKLNCAMALLFGVLTAVGYKRDKNERLHNSGEYDIQHAIRATYCDVFVSDDKRFRSKYKAVAYYMGIPIEIMSFEEFENKYC